MDKKKNNVKIIDGMEVQEIIIQPRKRESWEYSWHEQGKIVHAIWDASLVTNSTDEMIQMATEELGYASSEEMFKGLHASSAEAAFCGRPKDWKKGDGKALEEMDKKDDEEDGNVG